MLWYVVTPEYAKVVPILDDGGGPTEYGCDYVEVRAETKRKALVAAVRQFRAVPNGWLQWHHEGNPFTGLKAEPVEVT